MELEAIRIFVKVAEQASFTRAAEQLGLSKGNVSARIAELESELGAQLFLRTTRSVRLTEDGEQLAPRARRLLAESEEVQSLFAGARGLRGKVRIDLPIRLARDFIIPRLPELLALHPQLELQVSATDRRVDLIRDGFDCVLRVGPLGDSGLTARKLGELAMINLASPGYLARYGTPRKLGDLRKHWLVNYSSSLNPAESEFEYRGKKGYQLLPMNCLVTVNNTDAYEAACLAGLGIIQSPRIGKNRQLAEGKLVEVLPDFTAAPLPVSLVHGAASARALSKRVRAVMTWLEQLLAPQLKASAREG